MYRVLFAFAAAAGLLAASGCNANSRTALLRSLLSTVNEQIDIWSTVRDDASARVAYPKLKELTDRVTKITEKLSAKGKPNKETAEALENQFKEEIEYTAQRAGKEIARINDWTPDDKEAETVKSMIVKFRMPSFEMYLQPPTERKFQQPAGGPAPGGNRPGGGPGKP
jgi:hypothetical protein